MLTSRFYEKFDVIKVIEQSNHYWKQSILTYFLKVCILLIGLQVKILHCLVCIVFMFFYLRRSFEKYIT